MNSFSPQLFTRRAATCLLAGAALLFPNPFAAHAEVLIKDGQKLAFMGDSITQGGWGNPGGYVRLTIAGLEANGAKVTPIPAGIGGHKSDQMLARLKKDVLEKKPDFMTLSCGVNDVWHGARGVLLDQYKVNITAIVDQCAAAGVKVVILTATVIGEELDNDNNKKLAPYNEFLRSLAAEKKLPLADLYSMFAEVIKTKTKPGNAYTSDGVHMNSAGDQIMAKPSASTPRKSRRRRTRGWIFPIRSACARASISARARRCKPSPASRPVNSSNSKPPPRKKANRSTKS